MMKLRIKIVLLLAWTVSLSLLGANENTLFRQGDKVCFIGNSITQDGRYHMLFHHYFATRFPEVEVEFYSCGVSGDVAEGMLYRMENDILSLAPDYAFLMTGMNDMGRYLYDEGVTVDEALLQQRQSTNERYKKLTKEIAERLTAQGVKMIFLTPSIYDHTAKIDQANAPGANDVLSLYGQHVKHLAQACHAPVVDFNSPMDRINRAHQALDSTFTMVGPDRVHPGDDGHFVMNYLMVSTLFDDPIVSRIVIDAKRKRVKESKHCALTINPGDALSFEVLAQALPFAITPRFEGGLEYVPFLAECNQELVQIEGLKKGPYTLQIDGKVVGNYSAKELEQGINLAMNRRTPQYKQAEKVFDLCEAYHRIGGQLRTLALIDYKNLRQYDGEDNLQAKKEYLETKAEESKGMSWYGYQQKVIKSYVELKPDEELFWQQLNEKREEIYKSNKPVRHTYTLQNVKQ